MSNAIVPRANLDDFLPIRDIYINGTLQKFASHINFVGLNFSSTVTQNSDGTYTLNIEIYQAGADAIEHTSVDADYTVTETDGLVILLFSSLSAARAINLPANGNTGMRVRAGVIDNSLTDVNALVWTPASGNISRANVSAATFVQTQDDFPLNSFAEFVKTSTLWLAQ
jgi:hypothetical protein